MIFELNNNEIEQIRKLSSAMREKIKQYNGFEEQIPRYYAEEKEMLKIHANAHERALKYYRTHLDELPEKLKFETKISTSFIAAMEESNAEKELRLEAFLKENLKRDTAPYLEMLKENRPQAYAEIISFFDYAFEHRAELFKKERGTIKGGKTTPNKPQLPPSPALPISNEIFFAKVWQGTGTNELVKITTSKNTPVDPFKNSIIIKRGDFELTIETSNPNIVLRTSTHKLLDILMLTYSETREKEVTISIQDFMKLRGLKDRKTAEEQVKEDLATLYSLSASFRQKEGNKIVAYNDARIIQGKGQSFKNGIIRVKFGDDFFNAMQSYHVMPMPPAFLALNDKHNPNSYHLGRRIALHKNMNYGKPNEDLIGVITLLEACPNLRTHEEVYKNGKQSYTQKIIDPFYRDMNELEATGIFTWEYCHSNGMPLTDEELENLNYEIFKKLLVKITWHIYPAREIKVREEKPKARTRKTNKRS